MISSGLFDSNKVKLVDIENNDLEKVFGKWKQLPQKPTIFSKRLV